MRGTKFKFSANVLSLGMKTRVWGKLCLFDVLMAVSVMTRGQRQGALISTCILDAQYSEV